MKTNEIKCCTPNGQIKRYKDCIGCDRNPLELNQNNMTAVEWLQMKMATSPIEEMVENINVWFSKAKKMEKKIIVQAFEDGDYNYFYSKKTGKEFENGLEYYNEKFKSE